MSDDKRSVHHRIWPYSTEVVQYATERSYGVPWIVRDRQAALRAERLGEGQALVRVWIPTGWEYVNEEEN